MDTEGNSVPAPLQAPKPRAVTIWLGIGAGLLTGAVMLAIIGAITILAQNNESSSANGLAEVWLWSTFITVPFAIGFTSGIVWSKLRLSNGAKVGYGLLTTALAMGLAAVFLREGAICLLMASPLLVTFLLLGVGVGTDFGMRRNNRLRVSVLPLLAVLVVSDALSPHHYTNAVTYTVVIHAPAAKVWPYLAGYPAIQETPNYWLWRIGLPCPVQSVADGVSVGAARECRFTDGGTIGERITEVVPDKRLAFAITRQPNNPEIMGHFVLDRGAFDLTDNKNGTCTLSGTSWYALNIYPSWYYDLWTVDIVRHVHLRVMRHIQMLAETG